MFRPTEYCYHAIVLPFISTPTLAQAAEQPPVAAPAPAPAPAQAQSARPADPVPQQTASCPAPGEKVEVKKSSQRAKEGGAAAGGTAAQIAAGSLLGPVGAAVAAVVGAHAGKKAGSAVKTKKKVDAAGVRRCRAAGARTTSDGLAASAS